MPSVNVGSASVTIMPSMSGFAAKVNKGLGSAGASGGAAFSKSFADGASPASGGLLSKFKSAGTSAGSQMGASIGSALSAKGAAIAGLIERLGLEREDVIACGDGLNDLAMIKYAGLGVAMGNACDEALAAADYVTASVDDDGIRRALEHFGVI